MNIAYSIPFYFNFGKGHYFVLRVKQHIFGQAQIFQMNRVNPAIIKWREKKVETYARRLTSFILMTSVFDSGMILKGEIRC